MQGKLTVGKVEVSGHTANLGNIAEYIKNINSVNFEKSNYDRDFFDFVKTVYQQGKIKISDIEQDINEKQGDIKTLKETKAIE